MKFIEEAKKEMDDAKCLSEIAYGFIKEDCEKAEKELEGRLYDYLVRGTNPHGVNFKKQDSGFGESLYKSMVKK